MRLHSVVGATRVVALPLLTAILLAGCKKKLPPQFDASTEPEPVDAATAATAAVDAAAVDPDAGATPLTAAVDAGHHAVVTAAGSSGPFVVGETWSGAYNCGGANTLALKITSASNNKIGAVFDFHTKTDKTGSFAMIGVFDPLTRHLILNATNWIKQPPGFVTVNLDGFVSEDKHGYLGRAVGPGCSTFGVRR